MNKSLFLLALFLLLAINLPKKASNSIRSFTVASLSPVWHTASSFKQYLSDRPIGRKKSLDSEEIHRLQLENQSLRTQLESVLETKFAGEASAVAAKVIYRDPSSWSSSIWINVGKKDSVIIEKNCPVVVGESLIGVVDYVGKGQSRVRLITDSGISPAVRVARGKVQDRHLTLELQTISELLSHRPDLFTSEEEKERFHKALEVLTKRLEKKKETHLLAKGELQGSSAPLWRSQRPLLKGIGFNFDYPDEQGNRPEGIPILKEGDLLVTSGLDGLFPPGLSVATVLSLKDGGYAYELSARPTVRDFNHLETVYILPVVSNE